MSVRRLLSSFTSPNGEVGRRRAAKAAGWGSIDLYRSWTPSLTLPLSGEGNDSGEVAP